MRTIMSSKKGIRMIETIIAESDVRYSLIVSWLNHKYSRSIFSSSFLAYSVSKTGVTSTTEMRNKKTHRMTVFVEPMTESLVQSSQMMSACE